MNGLSVLSRVRAGRPEPSPYERCEMCGAPVADAHSHVVDMGTRTLMCTCRPCFLLFAHDDATLAYRAVPERRLSFPDLPPPVWEELELPVGTAFLFLNSALNRVVAFYPGPAGATESELPLDACVESPPDETSYRYRVPKLSNLLHKIGRASCRERVCYPV